MSIKARLPEFLFKRRKKERFPESIEIKLEVKDANGMTIDYCGCWDWDTYIRRGLVLDTGRTNHDMTGASARLTIGPPRNR